MVQLEGGEERKFWMGFFSSYCIDVAICDGFLNDRKKKRRRKKENKRKMVCSE